MFQWEGGRMWRREEKRRGLTSKFQTVVPGFEFSDHDFLPTEKLRSIVDNDDQADELRWLIKTD